MSLIERAGKAVAIELGYCDPDEWGTGQCNREDRDTALRAAAAALDAANCEGAVEELREVLRAVLMEPDPIKRNQLAVIVLTTTGGQ